MDTAAMERRVCRKNSLCNLEPPMVQTCLILEAQKRITHRTRIDA